MRKLLVIGLLGFALFLWFSSPGSVPRDPGVLAPATPEQTPVSATRTIRVKDFALTPFARFELEARILAREDYYLGTESELSPTDLAFGWGRMSDTKVIDALDISQAQRWYYWRYEDAPPIPRDEIIRSSANMHLIPANDGVARTLARAKPGQIAKLSGYLVNVKRDDGQFTWQSSRTRDDSGDGACELILVESLALR